MSLFVGAGLLFILGVFSMRKRVVRYYNTMEPIGLKISRLWTFLFSTWYLQHCFTTLASLKKTRPILFTPILPPTAESIRAMLKGYDTLIMLGCLECGYNGKMGVVGKQIPWYLTWWVLVPLICTGIGLIPAIFLGIWRYSETRHFAVCPACRRKLLQKHTVS